MTFSIHFPPHNSSPHQKYFSELSNCVARLDASKTCFVLNASSIRSILLYMFFVFGPVAKILACVSFSFCWFCFGLVPRLHKFVEILCLSSPSLLRIAYNFKLMRRRKVFREHFRTMQIFMHRKCTCSIFVNLIKIESPERDFLHRIISRC